MTDYAAIRSTINNLLADNSTGDISASDVRSTLEQLLAATEAVDAKVGTGTGTGTGTVDLTPYLTTAAADTKYATIAQLPDLTGYLTTAAADAKYALATAIPTAPDLTGYLKADGTTQVAATFTPTSDRDLVYKAWVEQKIASASMGTGTGTAPDLSTYLLKTEADAKYATIAQLPDITGLLTTTVADGKYALKTDIVAAPDLSPYLTSATAATTYATIAQLPDVSGFITGTAADAKYALKTDIPAAPDLTGYLTTAAADAKYALTSAIPTVPDLTGYLTSATAETTYVKRGGVAEVHSKTILIAADTALSKQHHEDCYLLCKLATAGVIALTIPDTENWSDWAEIGIGAYGSDITLKAGGTTTFNGTANDVTVKAGQYRMLKKMPTDKDWFIAS